MSIIYLLLDGPLLNSIPKVLQVFLSCGFGGWEWGLLCACCSAHCWCCFAFLHLVTFLELLGVSQMSNNCIFHSTSIATAISNKLSFLTIAFKPYIQYYKFYSFKSVSNAVILEFNVCICIYIYIYIYTHTHTHKIIFQLGHLLKLLHVQNCMYKS